jgi:hypothetical protein
MIKTFAAVAMLLATSTLYAATPSSGTLAAANATVTWSGGPYTGTTVDNSPVNTSLCTTLTCDNFTLSVNIPANFYTTYPNDEVQIGINWASNLNEFDLFIYDSGGNIVASSAQSFATWENIDAGQLPAGNYTVWIVASPAVNATYSGKASIAPYPAVPSGRARYQAGAFTFSTPFELNRPTDIANSNGTLIVTADQDVEPRIGHDPLGNLYVAAIEGVPGGVDVWKSMDGGKSFNFLGEPDGAQAAAMAGATGAGVGGGDEDLAIAPNGTVWMNSLWLGSTTQCTSTNGGATWIDNPVGSNIVGDDRQWIANYGNNIVYLTYKQLGALLSGTESILVVKSIDGGLTFGPPVEVTTQALGVQPGDQGNIAVDARNGYVYTVFFDSTETRLYIARSIDGGHTWTLKLIYAAPVGAPILGNIFAALAIDRGSGLHVVFSDAHHVFLTSSSSLGAAWTPPVRVNNGSITRSAMQPWVTAGALGKVNVTWLGSNDSNALDAAAQWQVFMAQTTNAFANLPVFAQSAVTGINHVGAICNNGLACASGTRNMAEYWTPDVYLDGNEYIVYPDDHNSNLPSGSARTWFVRQTGGPTVE